jgi:hypothetical protein
LYYCCYASFFLPIEHNLEGKSIACHIDALNQIKAFAFSTACTSASTRDVCPVPDEINVPFFCKDNSI